MVGTSDESRLSRKSWDAAAVQLRCIITFVNGVSSFCAADLLRWKLHVCELCSHIFSSVLLLTTMGSVQRNHLMLAGCERRNQKRKHLRHSNCSGSWTGQILMCSTLIHCDFLQLVNSVNDFRLPNESQLAFPTSTVSAVVLSARWGGLCWFLASANLINWISETCNFDLDLWSEPYSLPP